MMPRRAAWVLAAGLLPCVASGCGGRGSEEFRQGGIVVSRVVAAAPVVAGTLAEATMGIFLVIANEGEVDDTLVGVESPLAAKSQLHGMMAQGGATMMMMPVEALPVPPHREVRLKPGGMHIMLEGLRQPVSAGETVPLVLIFRRAGRLPVRVRVVRYDQLEQSLGGGAAPPAAGPDLSLRRSDGRVFDLAQERGRVVLVFFGYTHCPDLCPLTLANFAGVRRRLGPRAADVRFVFVTVDPGRDTPEVAMAYARQFDRSFVGLSGDSVDLAAAQRSFHVASWVSRDSTGAIEVAHSASVFVIGRDGRLARVVPYGDADVEHLYADVREALGA